MAQSLLGLMDPNVYVEEYRAMFTKFYEACKAGLEWYAIQARLLEKRLHPRD